MFECDCPPFDCAGRVERYLAGDDEAGGELARKFQPLVRRIIERILGAKHREEWDDACQAVFLRLFANLGKWERRCPFCKWLAVVAARRAIDFSRALHPLTQLTSDVPDLRSASPSSELVEQIARTRSSFPEPWRRVWDMWVDGAPREEIARRLQKSVRTIHYWISEMLEQVREAVKEED